MGTRKPPEFVHVSPKCLADRLRELANLVETGSREILETDIDYATSSDGQHLTLYHVVHAPGRS